MSYQKYTYFYFIFLLLSILFVLSLNLSLKSFYANRPLMALIKKPTSIIIGTSTTNFGFNPQHKSISNKNYFSISVGGVKNKLLHISDLAIISQ